MFAKENNLLFQERLYEIVIQITNGRRVQTFKLSLLLLNQIELHIKIMNRIAPTQCATGFGTKEYLTLFFSVDVQV